MYVSDLKILEASGLLKPGACIFADNVRFPGVPQYVKYLENHKDFDTKYEIGNLNFGGFFNINDKVGISIYKKGL